MAENGNTATPTIKSATANETMNRFVTDLSLDEQKTAAITRQLPTITITFMSASTANETKICGLPQVTFSSRAAHAVAFNVLRITTSMASG